MVSDLRQLSPTSKAKCRKCRKIIEKGSIRYGVKTWNRRLHKDILFYFHDGCCPPAVKRNLNFEEDVAPPTGKSESDKTILQARAPLLKALRKLRDELTPLLFGSNAPCYYVLQKRSMDEIVIKLPRTKADLMKIWGIQEQRFQNCGHAVLRLVDEYIANHPDTQEVQNGENVTSGIKEESTHNDEEVHLTPVKLEPDWVRSVSNPVTPEKANGEIVRRATFTPVSPLKIKQEQFSDHHGMPVFPTIPAKIHDEPINDDCNGREEQV